MTGNLHDWHSGHPGGQALPGMLLALALLLAPDLAGAGGSAGDRWRCTAGAATAYRQVPATGRWKTLVIPVSDQRFVVRRGPSPGRWELVREGSDGTVLPCAGDFAPDGLLHCGAGDEFEMNRNALTFTSHLFGATSAVLKELTAATATGTCVAL